MAVAAQDWFHGLMDKAATEKTLAGESVRVYCAVGHVYMFALAGRARGRGDCGSAGPVSWPDG